MFLGTVPEILGKGGRTTCFLASLALQFSHRHVIIVVCVGNA